MDVQLLKEILQEIIKASPEYMKKEAVRQQLQDIIASKVKSGEIADKKTLDEFFSSVDVSLKALKMIPYEVWAKIATKA